MGVLASSGEEGFSDVSPGLNHVHISSELLYDLKEENTHIWGAYEAMKVFLI